MTEIEVKAHIESTFLNHTNLTLLSNTLESTVTVGKKKVEIKGLREKTFIL